MATLRDVVDHIGYPEPLERLVLSFYEVMSKDVMIGFFFTGKDLQAIAHRQTLFIARAAGYQVLEFLRSPAAAHAGLPPINLGFFNRRLTILEQVLKQSQLLDDALISTWLNFERSFEDAVVQRVNISF